MKGAVRQLTTRLSSGTRVYDVLTRFKRTGVILWPLLGFEYRILWDDGTFDIRTRLTFGCDLDAILHDLDVLLAEGKSA